MRMSRKVGIVKATNIIVDHDIWGQKAVEPQDVVCFLKNIKKIIDRNQML
jgi:hypothetical protein